MEELLYLVRHKEDLPSVNNTVKLKGMFDDSITDFKVKKITELRWNDKGDLIITIQGHDM